MTDMVDCVVVGAGVIGLAVARQLALDGHETLLVERQEAAVSCSTHTAPHAASITAAAAS